MYFDAVLDRETYPVFNGTPAETKEWLQKNPQAHEDKVVCVGRTMKLVSIPDYLSTAE